MGGAGLGGTASSGSGLGSAGASSLSKLIKLKEPGTYSGRPAVRTDQAVENWVFDIDTWFALSGVADDMQRGLLAGRYLTDLALGWLRDMRKAHGLWGWQELRARFLAKYKAVDGVRLARLQLERLRQGKGSIEDYTHSFEELARQAGIGPDEKLWKYLQGMD